MGVELEDDALALYDRQIRLWGAAAQAKLGTTRVALVGIGALGSEIAKNLVLGGIGSIVVIDNSLTDAKKPTFLIDVKKYQTGVPKALASLERLSELNPRVKVETINENWMNLDNKFWGDFDIIIGTQLSSNEITCLNSISRKWNIPLIATACHGLFGMAFIDAITTESWITKEKITKRELGPLDAFGLRELIHCEDVEENGTHWDRCLIKSNFREWRNKSSKFIHLMYPNKRRLIKRVPSLFVEMLALLNILGIEEKCTVDMFERSAEEIIEGFELPTAIFDRGVMPVKMLSNNGKEFQPVAAIMGGFVSQTTINIIVQREIPSNNFILLNGLTNEMPIFTI